jgi:hypothetical protein
MKPERNVCSLKTGISVYEAKNVGMPSARSAPAVAAAPYVLLRGVVRASFNKQSHFAEDRR